MSDSLKDLYGGSSATAPAAAPEPQAPVQPEPQAAPEPSAPEPGAKAPDAPTAKQPDAAQPAGQDTGSPPDPADNDGRDPAFGRLRKERNDYREQASTEKVERARAEEREKAATARLQALEAELARLRAPQQQQQPAYVPNPAEDPQGYAIAQQAAVETRILKLSEAGARRSYGNERVNEARDWFNANIKGTATHGEILNEDDPWDALVKRYDVVKAVADQANPELRAKAEAETRQRLEAEIRAQIAAEAQAVPQRQSAPPNLPPSLGKVASAGARAGAAYTGPDPIESLFG